MNKKMYETKNMKKKTKENNTQRREQQKIR